MLATDELCEGSVVLELARWLPRFRKAERSLATLASRETWSREAIDAWQLTRLNALWADAIAHVPYYRALHAEHRLPDRFATFAEFVERVPVLRKGTLRDRHAEFLSARRERGRWYSTGGSTGRPMRVFWSHADHSEAMRAKYRFYASRDVGIFDRTAFLWGATHGFAPGWRGRLQHLRERLVDRARNRLRLSAYTLDDASLDRYLLAIRRFRPEMLYGFSRAVHLLARRAIDTGFVSDSLRLVVLSSEVATPTLIETVERAFGAPVAMEYGAAECPFIAGEDRDGRWRVREDRVIVETLPRDDGRYDVVLTVLSNRAFPLLRYAIEDVVDRPLAKPLHGFAILPPVSGRNDELLLTGRGDAVHPTAIDAIFEAVPAIRRYRVHQHADGEVVARLVLMQPLADADLVQLREQLAGVMSRPSRIEVVDTLASTAAGKHRAISSDLKPDADRPAGSADTALVA